jgi:hypothetical protein
MVAGNANQVLALTRRDPNIMNITGLTSLDELVFNQNGSTLTAIYPDGNSTNFYVDGMPQWFALQALYNTSEIATYELVQHATLVGSDPITTGALAAARVQDTTTPAVYADLLVAQDYARYRANAEIINTAMAANPDSDFTAGWNVTLMRARGLGLDRIVNYPGWTADLTDSHETIRDAAGNVVQQLQFNADGSVSTDAGTAVFNFNFVDSHLTYGANGRTYLTGPDGVAHDVTGATRLFFNDGHIDEADGNPLVDDLYYDSQYHDVYLARIDPDAHYAANGWHEGRNPNASFDTNYYLSNNPDVAASGVNPLDQYDANGWQQGRNPSARFSTNNYLRAYPSVAAAGVDPILDFMRRGFAESLAGIGDFNRDGTSDVLWYNPATSDTAVSLLRNGQVASGVDIGPHPIGYQIVGVGDFNRDGTTDVLWCDTSTTATDLWILNNGGWAGSVNVGTHPAGYQVAGVGDFNHDGMSDVLWYNPATTQTDLWMLSNGVWTNSVITGPHPAGYQIAGIGDFNRDGMSDVLWYNSSTGATDIWLLSNGQWGASVITGPAPQGYQIAGVADFNRDGMSDVLWYNPSTTDTALWILNNGAWAGSIDIGPHPAGYQVGGAGDFNHDGMNDVLWYNPSTRNADVWLLNNGNWAGSVIIGTQR